MKYLSFSLYSFSVCILGEKRWGKEESNLRTECGGDHQVAGLVSVVQPCFSLPANLADWLFLRVKVDFSHSFSSVFCGNYVNYTSHHCVFSTSFDLTFRTNKRIIIFMGNLCFMV